MAKRFWHIGRTLTLLSRGSLVYIQPPALTKRKTKRKKFVNQLGHWW